MEKIPEKEPILINKDTSIAYSLTGAIFGLNPYTDIKDVNSKIEKFTQDSVYTVENVNVKLKELDLGVSVRLEEVKGENMYESYMDILNSGKAIVASCRIKEEEEKLHHIALVKNVNDEIVLMDSNTRLGRANTNILKDMLNDGREIEYLGGSSIRFDDSPIIVVEKV